MLKILWVIVASYNIDGFEVVNYTSQSFDTAGECVTEIIAQDLDKDPTVDFDCRQTYNGKKYVSQPSWMSNEQADILISKQNRRK